MKIISIGSKFAVPDIFMNIWDEIYSTLIEDDYYKEYLKGLAMTIFLAASAIIIGTAIGSLVASTIKYSKDTGKLVWLRKLFELYVTVIRGTPIIVQLFFTYYIIFKNLRNATVVAVAAFSINSGAYVSEIIRGGFESIDRGQVEAGRSLGLSRKQTMRRILLPQVTKNILPALGNEFISLIKETSVVGYITIMDLTYAQKIRSARNQVYVFPLLLVALTYLVLVVGLGKLMKKMEKRLAYDD